MSALADYIEGLPDVSAIIISIALMLIIGFAMTRITKKLRLPNVTAYILAGILMGPYCLHLVPVRMIAGMDFLSDIALAFIAFSTGEYFRFSTLKKNGGKVAVITVAEALVASLLVFVVAFFFLRLGLAFSLVLGALAAATAPASTVMTIRQTGAKGDFVDTLLQVVALDDLVGLVAYSVAISVAVAAIGGSAFRAWDVIRPILINLAVLLLGAIFGVVMKLLMPKRRSTDNRLIIAIALLFSLCGICTLLDVSPLLGCMSMGTIYINITDDEKLFRQLGYFSPPILLLFFVRSGLNFRLDALISDGARIGSVSLLTVGILYFLVRIIGKYGGAWLGCLITHKAPPVRRYLGLALIPQAGIAIGLATVAARTLGGEMGEAMETVILASSVLYELIGPAAAKLSLYLSHSYATDLESQTDVPGTAPDGSPRPAVEVLIDRLNEIQKTLPSPTAPSPEESAFDEAAEELRLATADARRRRWHGR